MDRFPQPQDPPEEGNCRRCKTFIHRDELLIDGCIECDDLLIEDMRPFWQGRPKVKPDKFMPYYEFSLGCKTICARKDIYYKPIDWRGLV